MVNGFAGQELLDLSLELEQEVSMRIGNLTNSSDRDTMRKKSRAKALVRKAIESIKEVAIDVNAPLPPVSQPNPRPVPRPTPVDPLPRYGDLKVDPFNNVLYAFTNGEWGAVCDDSFGEKEAAVACTQMGGYLLSFETSVSLNSSVFGVDNLTCTTGGESSILQCRFDTNHNCNSSEHVRVNCQF